MNYHNYKKVDDLEVENWLFKNIPEITAYQKQKIRDEEIVRFSSLKFFKRKEKVNNIFFRLTIILFPIVWILFFVSLPFNFIIRGRWGYSYKSARWIDDWRNALGG